jgi:transglutaminase-like putative cysteine protease
MKLVINHHTAYAYDEEVQRSLQFVRLYPRDNDRQKIINWELTLPGNCLETADAYGNVLYVVTMEKPHKELEIRAQGTVEISAEEVRPDTINPLYFLRTTRLTRVDAAIRDFAEQHGRQKGKLTKSTLNQLAEALRNYLQYEIGATQVDETAAEVFAKGRGVCQDYVHIFLTCCRYLEIPARYVSGYVFRGEERNYSSHAWVEAWIDEQWHTFDVTLGIYTPENHLQIAIGLDYLEACPVRGVRWGGKGESMNAFAAVELVDLYDSIAQS